MDPIRHRFAGQRAMRPSQQPGQFHYPAFQVQPPSRSVESHSWTEGEADENKDFHRLQCPFGSGHGGLQERKPLGRFGLTDLA